MTKLWMAIALLAAAALPARAATHSMHQFSVGTGILGYFSGDAPGTTAAWEARYGFTPTPVLTIEGGYLGGVSEANGPGATVATMIEGDIRINPLRGSRINPYGLIGVGWGAFSGTSTPSDNKTVLVPFGIGGDVQITDKLGLGVRVTYHLAAADHIGLSGASADNLTMMARLGAQF